MATTTPQLVLRKPAGTDLINVTTDISDNMDKIDAASRKVLGYAQAIVNQTGITAEVDLTSLSVAVTVGTGRRIRIRGHVANLTSTVANDTFALGIKEGATQFTDSIVTIPVGNQGMFIISEVILTPTSGSHTYKLTGIRANGTGSVTLNLASGRPAFILVEDIGAA